MKVISYIGILMSAITISACSHKVAGTSVDAGTLAQSTANAVVSEGYTANSDMGTVEKFPRLKPNGLGNRALHSYLVYKMKGDYADLVPVTINDKGVIYTYPDPVDITESQRPVALGDGWYLDRRGINQNTAFLDYTYEEYHKLPKVPSQDTLKAHIKVKRGIAEIWNCGTQQRTVEEYRKLVKDGFPGCKSVFQELTFSR